MAPDKYVKECFQLSVGFKQQLPEIHTRSHLKGELHSRSSLKTTQLTAERAGVGGSARESGDLRQENFKRATASARWNGVAPKEEKEPLRTESGTGHVECHRRPRYSGKAINSTGETADVFRSSSSDEESQTLTVTTTETHVVETGVPRWKPSVAATPRPGISACLE